MCRRKAKAPGADVLNVGRFEAHQPPPFGVGYLRVKPQPSTAGESPAGDLNAGIHRNRRDRWDRRYLDGRPSLGIRQAIRST